MADQPITRAVRENYAYTGESGARETKSLERFGKRPDEAAEMNREESRNLARRAASMAGAGRKVGKRVSRRS